jgi:hypothetical protein
MRYLSFTVMVLLIAFYVQGQQSPHGKSFQIDCSQCHTSQNWKVNTAQIQFNHDLTGFRLDGQHKVINCRDCHLSLTFKEARKNCLECHTDVHNQSLGKDCAKCHTPKSWIIDNVTEMHQRTRFPLLGAHRSVSCNDCHKSASKFQFEPLGIDCNDCHKTDFQNVKDPNHVTGKYSTNCLECHNSNSTSWRTQLANHDLFPLKGGHAVGCGLCHTSGHYGKISAECNSCHNAQFTTSLLPRHVDAGIPVKCETCHNINSWKPSTFIHLSTGFELKGAHAAIVQCSDCHKGNLTTAKQNCISCHQVQYDNAPDHKKVNYPTDCSKCHSQNNWVENSFNHSSTNYPLTGAHKTAKCGDCHLTTLTGTSSVCSSCHLPAYTNSQIPGHVAAGIPKECSTCHTTIAWKPSSFNHTATGYELKGAHKAIVQCSQCHKGNVTSAPQTCIACHQVQFDGAPNHKAQGYPVDCSKCHTQNNWIENNFNHSLTNFPLTGAHATVQCTLCHTSVYAGTPNACNSCHLSAYTNSQLPGHVAAGIPRECATCHSTNAWKPSSFNHTSTGYELKGAHKTIVQCSLCHIGNVTSAPQTCIACHQAQYDIAPGHKLNGFSTDCMKCHTQDNWLATGFDHSTTNFPLTGAHTKVLCNNCHSNGYTGTPATCNSCHLSVYTSSQLPGHVAAGIPKECAICHSTVSWKPSTFNHTSTGFELKGAHKSIVQCSQCHVGNVTSAPQTCIACHQAQYDVAPNHKANGYSTDCTKCHSSDSWLATNFDHSTTNFPLTGAHKIVLCSTCHVNGYTGTSTACNSCHLSAYTNSQLPAHVSAGIPKECAGCHSTTSWKPSSFNHASTGYVLSGAHTSIVQCSDCHKGSVTTTQQTCLGCHQAQYNTAPNHVAQSYPTDCTRCHSQTNWLATSFNHAATIFPLTGAHTSVLCGLCHTNGYLGGTPTACNSCHIGVYTSSQQPGHAAAGIPKECATCHTTIAWKPSTFNHTTTGYVLAGAHTSIAQCSDCHKGSVSTATQTCVGCHQAQYNSAPNHVAQGYPTDCTKCHTQVNWLATNFNHATTIFPLTGAHKTVLCNLCHTNGYSGGTPTACFSCHTAKYNATTNPNHLSAKFPTNCESCHSTTAWTPSTYNHDAQYFPINSGKHRGVWTQCTECHNVATNYAAFSCIICHTHSNKASVDGEHRDVKNYTYTGTSCYTCHPTGRGG